MNDQERKELERKNKRNRTTNLWVGIGAVILIILLMIWLTTADLFGDTDVNMITSLIG